MPKTTTETRTVNVQLDEYHDALLEGLCARPGQPRINKTEAMRWCLREVAKREGVTVEEDAA